MICPNGWMLKGDLKHSSSFSLDKLTNSQACFIIIFKDYKTSGNAHLQKFTRGPEYQTQIFQVVTEKQPSLLAQRSTEFDMQLKGNLPEASSLANWIGTAEEV